MLAKDQGRHVRLHRQDTIGKDWVRHGSFRPMVDIQSSSGFTVPPHLHEEISGSLGLGTTLAV
jgi:hypothetical protein